MKSPSVFVLLGLAVLLLSGLIVSAVVSLLSPSPWICPLLRLLVFAPFLVSTLLMTSLLSRNAGCLPLVSMEMAQPAEGAAGLDEDYDDITAGDITADVTTEYVF
ncbi:unnamed protein product [Pleuronectes platessa]|uniref:Uncharacterized protein n=1 Tax=Pleuronectes platessa TaxID=8262 RepID=A0A9N7U2G0_PLEPL|nr:unnamed protein product [Pleuronectes platessa]